MAKIPAEHDETNEINALIDSKLKLTTNIISSIGFDFISSGNRLRITPIYTTDFMNSHTTHIHYIDIWPNQIQVALATWDSSTQAWKFTSKEYT